MRQRALRLRRLRKLRGWRVDISEEVKKDFKEGALSLILCNLGDYISGFFLHVFSPIIQSAPILIALLPAASDARGDVYSSYGSRLGTLLHLGLAKKMIREELMALVTILISINFWVGALTALVARTVSAEAGIEPATTIFTAMMSAVLSATFMIPATTWLAFTAFKKGLDPDNLVAPIATLFGDMITVPTIIAGYGIAAKLPPYLKVVVIASLLSLAVIMLVSVAARFRHGRAHARAWRVIKQNLPVIMLATSFSTAAGIILLVNIEAIIRGLGILAVIPAFLEDGGAIACRFSARLSTSLHLGRVRVETIPRDRWVISQFIVNAIHAAIIFGALGIFGYAIALWGGATPAWGLKVFATVLLAGLILTAIISVLTYYAAIVSFKIGIDPDNVLAPILTSLADIIGTSSLAAVLLLIMH